MSLNFHERFRDRIDWSDGTVVYTKEDHAQLVHDVAKATEKQVMETVSKMCKAATEQIHPRVQCILDTLHEH